MTCCPGYAEVPGRGAAVVETHDIDCPTLPPPGWDDRGPWPPAPGTPDYDNWAWAIKPDPTTTTAPEAP